MLQRPMRSQLARLEVPFGLAYKKRRISKMEQLGPIGVVSEGAIEELKQLESTSKHWVSKGKRSISVAVKLLQEGKIIALATDTVYGLACSALNNNAIRRLYEIKGRDERKPLCISVSSVKYIKYWGVVDHLNPDLLTSLLPGPFTFVLKRQPDLNPSLNPGIDTVGIRVPDNSFINCISHIVGPLALTSANVSNKPSCLYPKEFENLWPQLDGIFYDVQESSGKSEFYRKGSTIVDLSVPNYYKIIRMGVNAGLLINRLKRVGLEMLVSD